MQISIVGTVPAAAFLSKPTPAVRWTLRMLVFAAGLLLTWNQRHEFDGDGLSYLDISDGAFTGRASLFVNAYWSPAYPAVLALLRPVVSFVTSREIANIHLINLVLLGSPGQPSRQYSQFWARFSSEERLGKTPAGRPNGMRGASHSSFSGLSFCGSSHGRSGLGERRPTFCCAASCCSRFVRLFLAFMGRVTRPFSGWACSSVSRISLRLSSFQLACSRAFFVALSPCGIPGGEQPCSRDCWRSRSSLESGSVRSRFRSSVSRSVTPATDVRVVRQRGAQLPSLARRGGRSRRGPTPHTPSHAFSRGFRVWRRFSDSNVSPWFDPRTGTRDCSRELNSGRRHAMPWRRSVRYDASFSTVLEPS